MYSYGPPHMAEQKQDDQLEHTYRSYVRIQDVALKTCLGRWTIGRSGERGSGISVLAAWHDDDDDDDICLIAMMLTGDNWFHDVFLRQSSEKEKDRKRKILEKSEKWKSQNNVFLRIAYNTLCVRVCVCAYYICVLLCVVVYAIVCMFRSDDRCVVRHIWGCSWIYA